MRGLNLLRHTADTVSKVAWKNYQQKQVACNTAADVALRPLFPGSMLFNQILVPSNTPVSSLPTVFPDTRDMELEYCNRGANESLHKNTIAIDIEGIVEKPPVDAIIQLVKCHGHIEQVAFLGKSARRLLKGLTDEINKTGLSIITVDPDWRSVYELHALYRDAHHVLFIDTMRVLDAAYTGCNCTLIATDDFRRDVAFDYLVTQLDKLTCVTYGSDCQPIFPEMSVCNFKIAENNIHDVNVQLASEVCTSPTADWLTAELNEKALPVIDVADNECGGAWSNVLDRRTRFLRKARKLREDPGAFLADSDYRILKAVSRVFPDHRKAG